MLFPHGTSLGRYRIISSLGAGGMGEVYCAEDTLLGRQVAIKVLPDHLSEDLEALKRFQKEAKALAALSHSNILSIHDFVSVQGISFVVMELLEGETLRSRIAKSQLSWQKAVEIAQAIAEGLSAAHSRGVIHRDLKPENILLTSQGNVKIVDFGLARLKPDVAEEELTQSRTLSHVTESGVVIGTVPYMAPEQVRGQRADARSDIFSFGCVLFEMLSGKRPFLGNTAAETTAAILRDEPAKLTDIPGELERIVMHCLEKDPERRLHSAHDLAFELKEIIPETRRAGLRAHHFSRKGKILSMVVLIAVVLAIAAIGLGQKFISRPASEKIESLEVLPLKNLSGDPEQEYFADGMTEELIGKLARISALRVISRTSVMEYKGTHKKSLPQIAKELNVDAIVEGSVMQSGNRVRITAQLIHAPTDKHLWTESYERDMSDIITLQNEVALAVAQEIRLKVTPQEQTHYASGTRVNPKAYETYLRGINYARRSGTKEDTQLAISMFERAIEIDSNFALAYAELSMGYSWSYHTFFDRTREVLSKAKQAVDRAFQIQPGLPEAYIALGYYHYWGFKNYEQALREFQIAQKTVPNHSRLLNGFASIYRRQGKFRSALQGFIRMLEIDPRDTITAVSVAATYDRLGDYSKAQHYYDLAISTAPDVSDHYVDKFWSYLKWTGDIKGARAIILKIPEEGTRNSTLQNLELVDRNYQAALDLLPIASWKTYENAITAGYCYRLMGNPAKARASFEAARIELEELLQESPEDHYVHNLLSFAYAGLNRKEEAIREAKKTVELYPVSKDAWLGPLFVRDMAIIYVMVGEYEAALDQIEYLLSNGSLVISPPMLRIHPTWDPLRSHPRFQKFLERYSRS